MSDGSVASTTFEKNSNLETWQVNLFSIFFWIYPIILAAVARILYRLHQRKPKLAFKLLALLRDKVFSSLRRLAFVSCKINKQGN